MRKSRPRWLISVWVVTLLYLMVEFAFNARLLDVVGGMPAPREVDAIECWGRCLSGFALALALWPTLLNAPRVRRMRGLLGRLFVILTISAIVIGIVYVLEKRLVDSIVDRSTSAERYVAVNLSLLQHAVMTQQARLDDLPLPPDALSAPDGKAFLSLLPLLAMSIDDIDARLATQRPELVRRMVVNAYGGPDGVSGAYNRYVDSLTAIRNDYDTHYVPESRAYSTAVADVSPRQNQAWAQYVASLRQRRSSPATVPRFWWPRVRAQVRAQGVPVPANWAPSDRAGFDVAVARRISDEALYRFRAGAAAAIPGGAMLSPGMSFDAFMRAPIVQSRWHAALGYPMPTAAEPYALIAPPDNATAYDWFQKSLFGPVVRIRTAAELAHYAAAAPQLADGAPLEAFGRDAMAALVAPPIALGFSLLGALVHVFKVFFYTLQLVTAITFRRISVKFAVILGGAVLVFSAASLWGNSPITHAPLYASLETHAERLGSDLSSQSNHPSITGRAAAFALRGVIQGEPLWYPLFERSRADLLRGYRFDTLPLAGAMNK